MRPPTDAPDWQLDLDLGELARLVQFWPDCPLWRDDVRALALEIIAAKSELADPDSRLSWLVYLVASWYLADDLGITQAVDRLLGAGHFDIEQFRKPNGYPDFDARATFKIPLGPPILMAAAEHRIIDPEDLSVREEGDPLIAGDDLRRVFLAHERVPNEKTLAQMGRAFNDLLANWRQGEQARADAFIEELRERGIGSTREAERMAQARGLQLSRRTISRRLRAWSN
jgi:hypothetical protein